MFFCIFIQYKNDASAPSTSFILSCRLTLSQQFFIEKFTLDLICRKTCFSDINYYNNFLISGQHKKRFFLLKRIINIQNQI